MTSRPSGWPASGAATDASARGVGAARARAGAVALAAAGILFLLYQWIRPYSDEVSLQGAAAFGSTAWVVAHMLAMLGFTLLTVGLLGLYSFLRETGVERLSFWALVAGLVGVGLTLPFYGGEAFGLHAIGQESLRVHSSALLSLAPIVRGQPQLTMFTLGLLTIGVSSVLVAIAVWKSDRLFKWSGIPFAIGFVLYLPQFFGTQPVRLAHGLLVAAGCLWLAIALWRQSVERTSG